MWCNATRAGMTGAVDRYDGHLQLRDRFLLDGAPEVEHIVGNDTERDPAAHPTVALIAASSGAVAPLDHAHASFRPGAPFLTVPPNAARGRAALDASRSRPSTPLCPHASAAQLSRPGREQSEPVVREPA